MKRICPSLSFKNESNNTVLNNVNTAESIKILYSPNYQNTVSTFNNQNTLSTHNTLNTVNTINNQKISGKSKDSRNDTNDSRYMLNFDTTFGQKDLSTEDLQKKYMSNRTGKIRNFLYEKDYKAKRDDESKLKRNLRILTSPERLDKNKYCNTGGNSIIKTIETSNPNLKRENENKCNISY